MSNYTNHKEKMKKNIIDTRQSDVSKLSVTTPVLLKITHKPTQSTNHNLHALKTTFPAQNSQP